MVGTLWHLLPKAALAVGDIGDQAPFRDVEFQHVREHLVVGCVVGREDELVGRDAARDSTGLLGLNDYGCAHGCLPVSRTCLRQFHCHRPFLARFSQSNREASGLLQSRQSLAACAGSHPVRLETFWPFTNMFVWLARLSELVNSEKRFQSVLERVSPGSDLHRMSFHLCLLRD